MAVPKVQGCAQLPALVALVAMAVTHQASVAAEPAFSAATATASKHGFAFADLAGWSRHDSALIGDHLQVFIAPHTHDDTGWLETVDGYFHDKVRWILDTVTQALSRSRKSTATPLVSAYPLRAISPFHLPCWRPVSHRESHVVLAL
jgi:hypothetical protein